MEDLRLTHCRLNRKTRNMDSEDSSDGSFYGSKIARNEVLKVGFRIRRILLANATTPSVRSLYIPRTHARVPRVTMGVRSKVITATPSILTKLKKECATPVPVLRHVADSMAEDMKTGLKGDGKGGLPMILSYVDSLPTGKEKGSFYALDLGGTNFRVLKVELGGKNNHSISPEFEQMSIPQELMLGTSEDLFDFIASALAKFTEKESAKSQKMPGGQKKEIGFTFSFPVKQTAIDSGILIKWTKGFNVSGTPGRDVVVCLNEAMERRGLNMRVSALVNDTVATLAGARYWDNDVMVAVILGTGTNACYVERVDAIPKFQGHSKSGTTIINTEWGAFSNGLPLTEFDKDMDDASINPGEQIYEKTISGMYLGEIARRVLVKLAKVGSLFGDCILDKLTTPFALRTPHICAIQQDNSQNLEAVEKILYDVAGVKSDLSARKIVVDVCDTIVKRGGRLAGAGIVGILQKMEQGSKGVVFGKRTVVAMDGGLYEHFPQYRRYVKDAVDELLGLEISKNVIIEHRKDTSGTGAALLAATNSKYGHAF